MVNDDEDTTSECDSDYEYLGGDAALYDSALDGADELLFVKESLGRLFEMGGQQLEQSLLSGLNAEECQRFNNTMAEAPGIRNREDKVNHALEKTAQITKMKRKGGIFQ